MKRATFYLKIVMLACMTVWVSTSCGEKEKESAPELTYLIDGSSPATLSVLSGGVTKTVSVASNRAWNIAVSAGQPPWIQVSPDRGEKNGSFTLTVAENTLTGERTGTITFSMEGTAAGILTVTQAGADAGIEVTPATVEPLPATGGAIEFTVAADAGWSYSLSAGADAWLSQTAKTAATLTLTAAGNASTAARNASVTFSLTDNPDMTQTVNISQAGATEEEIMNEEDFGAGVTPVVHNISAADLKTTLEQITAAGNYIVNVTGNTTLTDAADSESNIILATAGATVSLRGVGGNTVTTEHDASILRITEGKLILRNITLSKTGSKMPTLFIDANGTVEINEGVYITGSGESTNAGVNVNGGAFLMKGGEIHGHRRAGGGAGLFIHTGGVFRMDGGKIYDNTADYGGGMFIRDAGSRFIMNGGELYDNHSGPGEGGGAVYIYLNGGATINPGATIYGETGGDNKTGNTGGGGATFGHAVSAYFTDISGKYRSTTIRGETLSITVLNGVETESTAGTWTSF
ncbi:MAG: hypothetical protein LBL04_09175 [Bacteroidales bacterium]|jgi:hypothetical protein|nr:hypothetical protein [Bacteroidales bacterium]